MAYHNAYSLLASAVGSPSRARLPPRASPPLRYAACLRRAALAQRMARVPAGAFAAPLPARALPRARTNRRALRSAAMRAPPCARALAHAMRARALAWSLFAVLYAPISTVQFCYHHRFTTG